MSDLPAIGRIVPGLAHIQLTEAIGPAPASEVPVLTVRLSSRDMHSASSDFAPLTSSPLGMPVFSVERWVRFHLTPPFGRASDFKLWATNLAVNPGWQLRFGVAPIYARPTAAPSVYATGTVPSSEPEVINVGDGVPGPDGSTFTPWLVFQASVTGSSSAVLQDDPITLELGWTEA